jgi:flavin reductase (DIM6/NTAB) family NADH-FMN oxidoreductase RutF
VGDHYFVVGDVVHMAHHDEVHMAHHDEVHMAHHDDAAHSVNDTQSADAMIFYRGKVSSAGIATH